MLNCLKKNLSIIIVVLITLALIILNARLGYIIMGADNASPYFNPIDILTRIKDTSSVIFGGIVFQVPFLESLKLIGMSPAVISNIYVFTNFFLGVLGIALILKRQTNSFWSVIFGSLVFITSLFTFFIFSQPNFLFIAGYGSIPMLIYLLSRGGYKWYHWVLLIIFSISFLTTTLNIVAFGLYCIQIFIIALILMDNKGLWKRNLIWGIFLILVWLGTIQIIMKTNGDTTPFVVNIYYYIRDLLNNVYMPTVTSGIIASEKTNTMVRTLEFALGWMELHNSNNQPLFEFYSLYRDNIVYTVLGVVPFLLSLLVITFKRNKRIIILIFALILFVIISSAFGMSLIEKVPYLSSSLRWASSKLWPMYIIPITVLPGIVIGEMVKNKKILQQLSIIFPFAAGLCLYGYPVLSGNLLAPKLLVSIPQEYFSLPSNSKILVLPHPQELYMRDFNWGYYGSDFLSYTSNSQIVDGANMYQYADEYEQILESGVIPNDIQYVIYNTSAETNLDPNLKSESKDLVKDLKVITSNKYFTLYER
jgi:hypothetical protein